MNPTEKHPLNPDAGTAAGEAAGAPSEVQVGVQVGVLMGSSSDWETMRQAAQILAEFGVPHECRVVSAHRMPCLLYTSPSPRD